MGHKFAYEKMYITTFAIIGFLAPYGILFSIISDLNTIALSITSAASVLIPSGFYWMWRFREERKKWEEANRSSLTGQIDSLQQKLDQALQDLAITLEVKERMQEALNDTTRQMIDLSRQLYQLQSHQSRVETTHGQHLERIDEKLAVNAANIEEIKSSSPQPPSPSQPT